MNINFEDKVKENTFFKFCQLFCLTTNSIIFKLIEKPGKKKSRILGDCGSHLNYSQHCYFRHSIQWEKKISPKLKCNNLIFLCHKKKIKNTLQWHFH